MTHVTNIFTLPWEQFLRRYSRKNVGKHSRKVTQSIRKTRLVKSYVWDAVEVPLNKVRNMNNDDFFLGLSSYDDLIRTRFVNARSDSGFSTHQSHFSIICTRTEWDRFSLDSFIDDEVLYIKCSKENGMFVDKSNCFLIEFNYHASTISIGLIGDEEEVNNLYHHITKEFEEVRNEIEWIYSGDGQSIQVPLRNDKTPIDEMYPFLKGEPLKSYYDRYMDSSASILLLIGPPGTGKTTFIRGFLQHTGSSAVVSYDTSILEKDYAFAQFIEGDKNVFVIEDADMFLKTRKDGNTMMHRFLNVGDGLVSTKNKKLIFSTNLPTISDIDPALIRPGRCFDILKFENLNAEQSSELAKKLGVSVESNKEHSIAEIFFKKNDYKVVERKVGFY